MFKESVLLAAKKEILADPRRLRMGQWFIQPAVDADGTAAIPGGGYGEPYQVEMPPCGTVGCIAGWICVTALGQLATSRIGLLISDKADQLMGVDGWYLYHPDEWSNFTGDGKDYTGYKAARTPTERARIVGEVIDKFIAYQNRRVTIG